MFGRRQRETPMLRVFEFGVTAVLAIIATACSGSPKEDLSASLDPNSAPLAVVYDSYFPIGAAVMAGEYGVSFTSNYDETTLSQFNSFVGENCMKPGVIQPTKGNFVWSHADSLVAYAVDHGKTVRGHVLVWHSQTPNWMFASSGTQIERKEHARGEMLAHIDAVVGRYADSLYCWDVVNEAISDSSGGSVYRTESPWFSAYGDASYITDAFDYARAADPDALLYYNDYSVCDSGKRSRIVQMINDLDLKNHGLHGIGIQAHWNLQWPSVAEIQATIDTFHSMGLDVQITELDIDCYNNSSQTTEIPYASVESALTERYREIFECLRDNKDKISQVTLWGVADDHTWLDHMVGGVYDQDITRKNYPLLFDADRKPKKAFFAVRNF